MFVVQERKKSTGQRPADQYKIVIFSSIDGFFDRAFKYFEQIGRFPAFIVDSNST